MKKIYFLFVMLFACMSFSFSQLVVADKAGWSVLAYDLQNSGDPATNVLDGNYGSIWHTPWDDSNTQGYPHYIEVDMGKIYTSIPAFLYLARQDGRGNGRVKGYKLYFKENSNDAWSSPILGDLANTADLQTIDLSGMNISARYFKFEAISPQTESDFYASAAELGIASTVDITKQYNLKLSETELYLKNQAVSGYEDNGDFSLQNFVPSDATFQYTFIANSNKPCVYNIAVNGAYLNVSSEWKCVLGNENLSSINAQFVVEERNGTYCLRPLGRSSMSDNRCIGVDSEVSDSRIYADKTSDKWAYWELINGTTISPTVESKYPVENAIDTYYRDDLYVMFNRTVTLSSSNGITIKDASNQEVANVSVTVSGAKLVISHAPLVLNTTYTVSIPAGIVADYTNEITWSFTTESPILPISGVYNIVNATLTNYYLTYPATAPKNDSPLSVSSTVLTGTDMTRQQFQLIVPDVVYPDIYQIKENFTGKFLYLAGGNWRSDLVDTEQSNASKFVIIPDGTDYKIQAYQNYSTDNYLAPGSELFTDSYGCYLDSKNNTVWKLQKINDILTSNNNKKTENFSNVYPTISNGLITVVTLLPATIKIIDTSGRLCASYSSTGHLNIYLNVANGLYFVVIDAENTKSVFKIIKQN